MNTLHTVKNIGVAVLLIAASSHLSMHGVSKPQSNVNGKVCNFTQRRLATLDLVKKQSCDASLLEEVDNCFRVVQSDFQENM